MTALIVLTVALGAWLILICIKGPPLRDHQDAFDISLDAADWSHKETDQ